MYKNSKQMLCIILILVSFIIGSMQVFAKDGGEEKDVISEEEFIEINNEITLYSLATEKARCFFVSNKNPVVLCAKFKGTLAEKSVSVKLSLQKFGSGKWNTQQTWTGSTKKKVFTVTKRKSVGVGEYRAKAVFIVKTTNKSESFTKYSSVIKK